MHRRSRIDDALEPVPWMGPHQVGGDVEEGTGLDKADALREAVICIRAIQAGGRKTASVELDGPSHRNACCLLHFPLTGQENLS